MSELKLWLMSQTKNNNYDTYDSAVVVAATEDEARSINPGGEWGGSYSSWAPDPSYVSAIEIGTANEDLEPLQIVLSSFNAG